jgi:hypothetical protein
MASFSPALLKKSFEKPRRTVTLVNEKYMQDIQSIVQYQGNGACGRALSFLVIDNFFVEMSLVGMSFSFVSVVVRIGIAIG